MTSSNEIFVLYEGYSEMKTTDENSLPVMKANCTCTLIKNNSHNIIVDTMTAWDAQKILDALRQHTVESDQIDYVISTHGHADHIGNNNLFLNATHIVGFSISKHDEFYLHPFDKGVSYFIEGKNKNDQIEIIPTPGHTLDSISVLMKTKNNETVAITGDLFEKKEDLLDPNIWLDAGSENSKEQNIQRLKILGVADLIVPGHGPMFQVLDQTRMQYKDISCTTPETSA